MRDKLLIFSLVLATIGIAALYFAAEGYQPPLYTIADLNDDFYGKRVAVEAVATAVRIAEGNMFLTLKDETGSINAVAFNYADALTKGSKVRIEGDYAHYQEKPEIIIKKIEVLKQP